ncbi:CBS domain-containing protein [Leucobacter komagatae]|uniref:CBS domain-containing protein n=1 Tax=Leucobacter komagatae TaxID=55969 RepID=A0A0D0IVC8_9MICO|nr:CBS domain-containing protein [Leucobacter komagatae]KIP53553.1 hypothetical protein SD72_02455 [Leucobacter komagatae]
MFNSDEYQRVSDFLELVKPGTPWCIPTELFLKLNGNVKRGKFVNQSINELLKERGLVSSPSIEAADYYGDVIVSDPRDRFARHEGATSLPLSAFPSDFDGVIYFGRETPVSKIKAKMVSFDISQIPILSSDQKQLHGVVTWRSLALASDSPEPLRAQDVMAKAGHVASSGDDFVELVDTIIAQEYVLYRVPDGRINGIVTASDLARAFDGTASIYVRLQELENRLRILLDRSPLPELQKHLEGRRQEMSGFRGATDMMFGEYLSALKDPNIWAATGIGFDQDSCLSLLAAAKEVRNGVMHFSSGPEDESQAEKDGHAAVIRALRLLRAIPTS